MWIQQDACPAYCALMGENTLNGLFPNYWIGRGDPTNFPAEG